MAMTKSARAEDLPRVVALNRLCYERGELLRDRNLSTFEGYAEKGGVIYITEETSTGHVAAMGIYFPDEIFLPEERRNIIAAHVTGIASHPDFRGRGFGEHIVRSIIDGAKKRGLPYAFLHVEEGNYGAYSLYRKLDFEERGRLLIEYPTRGPAKMIRMVKKL